MEGSFGAQGLEGSRFVAWQLYKLAASGSRELPSAMFAHPVRLVRRRATTAIELRHVETFSGAACCQPMGLQCYKAAPLQLWAPRQRSIRSARKLTGFC